jgi:acid stress-induced BolA-like protein IbaG/YrbA
MDKLSDLLENDHVEASSEEAVFLANMVRNCYKELKKIEKERDLLKDKLSSIIKIATNL